MSAFRDDIYGDYVERMVWLEGVDTPLEKAIDELNALCGEWVQSLPSPRQLQHLSESALRVQDIVERNKRIRSLLHED